MNIYRNVGLVLSGSLALGCLAVPAWSGGIEPTAAAGYEAQNQIEFIEIDGVREFSGQLIARPLQQGALMSRGLSGAEALQRQGEARQIMAGFQWREYVNQTDEYVFYVPDGRTENDVANELMLSGLFQYVEPNWIVYPVDCSNDPLLSNQWHHNANRMQSCDGWDIYTGDPSVGVGICDTGVNVNHEDLQLHRREGYNAVDRVWENDGGNINDINNHGTWTTGCAAGNGNNNVGISGVGWDLSHRMLRVSNSSGGSSDLSTLQHAARTAVESGDKVASVSYSGVDAASNLTTATYIKSINGLLVWAAGNENRNLTLGERDADDIIVAAATDENDRKASFSNYGRFVDVAAPGVNVFTTDRGGGYAAVSGTSFACPLTAGLCALIWSANPDLTPDEVEQILKQGCNDLGTPGIDDTFGYGRINVFGSLSQVTRPVVFKFPDGLPDQVDPDGGTTVNVEILAEDKTPDTATAKLHYDDGSGYIEVAMPYLGSDQYEGTFGTTTCTNDVAFYFSVMTTDGELVTSPGDAPASSYHALSANGIIEIVVDNFEADTGWTVINENLQDGPWERATPIGNGGSRGDPPQDADGSGRCFVTDNAADGDVDGGPTRLISPTYNLAGRDPIISYQRWFSNDDKDIDRLTVEISNDDGDNWTLVESVSDAGQRWVQHSFRVRDVITPSSRIKMRFSAADNPNDSVTEAGLDDFRIEEIDCGGGTSDCLTLTVDNLVAGQNATFTITDGTPGVKAVTVYGLSAGTTFVNNQAGYCATFGIKGVKQNKVLGGLNQAFDSNGEISFNVSIPGNTAGTNVFFQSAMNGTCPDECLSNLVEETIQ